MDDIDRLLKGIVRVLHVDEHLLWQVRTVADCAYAWLLVDTLTQQMHTAIARDAQVRRNKTPTCTLTFADGETSTRRLPETVHSTRSPTHARRAGAQ
jgi:hypothetical protein